MKLIYLSDLHFYKEDHIPTVNILKRIFKLKPDVLILGGDISDFNGGLSVLFTCLRHKLPNTKIGFIPGNHDLWTRYWYKPEYQELIRAHSGDFSSIIYHTLIPTVCKEFDINFLETDPISVGNWAICGSVAWYDYSYNKYSMPNEYLQLNKLSIGNNDGRYIEFKDGDVSFANERLRALKKSIKNTLADKSIKNLAVMTHVPIFKDGMVVKTDTGPDYGWNLGTSFFYNLTFGKELIKQSKLRLAVSGHTHSYCNAIIQSNNKKNDITYLVSGADYEYPEFFDITLNEDGTTTTQRINFNGDLL